MRNRFFLIAAVAFFVGGLSCGDDKSVEPESSTVAEGLGAIPGDARVVLVADVHKLAKSELVLRAVRGMLERDPGLKARFGAMSEACGLDFASDIDRALVGLGDADGEVVLVAEGSLSAPRLAACAGSSLRKGGGNVITGEVAGQDAYHATSGDGQTDVWFAQTAADTVVAAASKAYLAAAIGEGPKIEPDDGLGKILSRAKKSGGVRFAGRIPPEVGRGIVTRTSGEITAPPSMVWGHVALGDGIYLGLSFLMATEADAKTAATMAPAQLAVLAQVAQAHRLGPLVEAIGVGDDGKILTLSLALSREQLAQALGPAEDGSAIDSGASAAQNPGPDKSRQKH